VMALGENRCAQVQRTQALLHLIDQRGLLLERAQSPNWLC
jgi:hypothetical protein